QPLCYELPAWYCELGHRKHPLQRWDREGPPIVSGDGFHHAASDALLVGPARPVFAPHFPSRAEAPTRRRFGRPSGVGTARPARSGDDPDHGHLRLRRRSLDAVYAQRWEAMTFFPPCVPGYAPELKPFAQ